VNYIEAAIEISPKDIGSDVLIAALSDLGFDSFVDTEKGFNAYAQEQKFSESDFKNVISDYSDTFAISYTINKIPPQNWNKLWEESFEPIDVDGQCYIRAPFHEPQSAYKYQIIIEPKMSFGTGHHSTTRLMIKKMMELEVKDKSLLDMGCGTGVLAILALKMGAAPVVAVDVEDWSVKNTLENLQRNGVIKAEVMLGDISAVENKTFFNILANINKNVLLADISNYAGMLEKNGNLLLSGFFETDTEELKQKAESCNLNFQTSLSESGWTLLHFNKL
jgi:ribosomal protein L11 methyltransferase